MDKTSKKVTKDPKRQERGKKSHETYMKRLKEKILEDNQMSTSSTSSSTCDPTPSTSSSTCGPTPSTPSHTTRSNDTSIYGVGILAVLAIGVSVFFAYNTSQAKIKKQANDHPAAQHEQKNKQERRHMLLKKIYTINE